MGNVEASWGLVMGPRDGSLDKPPVIVLSVSSLRKQFLPVQSALVSQVGAESLLQEWRSISSDSSKARATEIAALRPFDNQDTLIGTSLAISRPSLCWTKGRAARRWISGQISGPGFDGKGAIFGQVFIVRADRRNR